MRTKRQGKKIDPVLESIVCLEKLEE